MSYTSMITIYSAGLYLMLEYELADKAVRWLCELVIKWS